MKISWKYLLGAAIVLSMAAPAARAQQGGPPPGMRGPGRMMEMLLKDITLDVTQKAQVDSIRARYQKERPPMTPGEMPDEAARTKRRESMMKEQGEIRTILTDEQKVTFDKNVAEMHERMSRRG